MNSPPIRTCMGDRLVAMKQILAQSLCVGSRSVTSATWIWSLNPVYDSHAPRPKPPQHQGHIGLSTEDKSVCVCRETKGTEIVERWLMSWHHKQFLSSAQLPQFAVIGLPPSLMHSSVDAYASSVFFIYILLRSFLWLESRLFLLTHVIPQTKSVLPVETQEIRNILLLAFFEVFSVLKIKKTVRGLVKTCPHNSLLPPPPIP